jgi:A/G-specific adenine glycosylase
MDWFDDHERPLPWRASSPWGVLVSEFMLQQTPVQRVLPAWTEWMRRWPTPEDLASASVADALRAWGRLGYPRRARWLHQSAVLICEEHGGQVPVDVAELRGLPGVGEYTAAAVRAFAFDRRSVVLDTNVRRVLARVLDGDAAPPAHITSAERDRADLLWPTSDRRSARWSAAVMEFGALVCTARGPACSECPISPRCSWTAAGRPPSGVARRQPGYAGSDRQARGRIMAVLRERHGPVGTREIATAWPDVEQRDRALAALVSDGLVRALPRRRYALPG